VSKAGFIDPSIFMLNSNSAATLFSVSLISVLINDLSAISIALSIHLTS
jgi:hypothetical protein